MSDQSTVMTWNVENLFPPGHQISAKKKVQQADYDEKLAYLAHIIAEVVKPDVVALQEIGGAGADDTKSFDDLQSKLLPDYRFGALSGNPDQRGIRVGFLSKVPILEQHNLSDFASGELSWVPNWYPRPPIVRMGRGALRIQVHTQSGVPVRLITLHLKSKLVSYPTSSEWPRFNPRDEDERARGTGLALLRRTAEAVTVRTYLNDLMQSDEATHTIVLGDLNDEPRAATSQIILGPSDADASSGDQGDKVRLYNLVDSIPLKGDESNDHRFLPAEERFLRIYKGRFEMLDQILVSKNLLGQNSEIKDGQWKVQEVKSLVASITKETVSDNPVARVGKHRPDHAPVYARFAL
jgi:endonuclease/exonuclease/phosphatase family metal-dependent hydrolase